MPLRQSTLRFGSRVNHSPTVASAKATKPKVRTSSSPPVDNDTIVVDTSETNIQLPTPSESATDVSSESSQSMPASSLRKSRSKRVSSIQAKKSVFSENLEDQVDIEGDKSRSVSGETLIPTSLPDDVTIRELLTGPRDKLYGLIAQRDIERGRVEELLKAPSDILDKRIPARMLENQTIQEIVETAPDALDLMIQLTYVQGCSEQARAKAGLLDVDEYPKFDGIMDFENEDTQSVITVREESGNEEELEERRAARKAKMEEIAKKWEQRKKAAEKNATRRSGRASIMDKASEIIGNIKKTVLGKRTRGSEAEAECQPTAKKLTTSSTKAPGSPSKRQRMDEVVDVTEQPNLKKMTTRRDKKWLVSGLFAGQPRLFDARLTEDKNKRKSKMVESAEAKENSVLPLPMFAGERLLKTGRDFKLPFDVFSPLPAGQPKPDEWKKVNKNVFVGDAAAEWRTNKFVEHSRCLCNDNSLCDQDCMNRYMYYECDSHNCNVGASCGNRPFKSLQNRTKIGGKYNVGVEVIKTEDRGYGVRSNRTFDPDQIIVEYTGEIITQEECETRMRTIYKDNACYYLMLFDQNMIIDATRGSIARFVNHSCEPNCRMEKWTVEGKPRMALFAGDRGVMTGEELTYDYNFDPYSQKNVQECRCGAKTCRGVLGPKPKPEAKRPSPENETGKKKESKSSLAKRKMAEILEESTNGVNKKRKIIPLSKSKLTSKSQMSKSPSSKKTKGIPVNKARSASTKTKSPKRKVLIKKVTATSRKSSAPITTTKSKLARSDSKLKKMLVGAKNKATGSLKGRNRVVSSSSATETLLEKKVKGKSPVAKRVQHR